MIEIQYKTNPLEIKSYLKVSRVNNTEKMIIYDILRNAWDCDYLFNPDLYTVINWDDLLSLSFKQGVFPLIYNCIKDSLPNHKKMLFVAHWLLHTKNADNAVLQALEVQKLLDKDSHKYAIVKGFVLSHIRPVLKP